AGDTCSMSFTCCMMDKQSIIRTETIEDSTLIGIPTRYMDDWMSRYTSWKNFVMQAYNTRMLELVRTIDKIAFHNMDDRLRDYLRQRTQLAHSPVLNITHQDIASDLHASREAVSRLLKKMEQKGFLRLSRNQVEWLEPLD
ncbi:MAG: Crp/Fnr family transcriptional regulator, partial [Bacteroidota bacterium]